jgi:hypothetical protein
VLISAPHGAVHTRQGKNKDEDEFTAGFARLIAEMTGAHVLYLRRKSKSDPNWDTNIPYKDVLRSIAREKEVKFVFDIHGANKDRNFGIALGTMRGESCSKDQRELILKILSENGFNENSEDPLYKVDIDHSFTGKGVHRQETIIAYLHSLGIPAVQFELNAGLRIPERRPDASSGDKSYRGNPALISQTVEALTALVKGILQEEK